MRSQFLGVIARAFTGKLGIYNQMESPPKNSVAQGRAWATYHLIGIDGETTIEDRINRPLALIAGGTVVTYSKNRRA